MEIIKELPISKIKIVENVRTSIKDDKLYELMNSIKQHGLKQPIGVVELEDGYRVVWGHRRLKACKKLGWTSIEAKIIENDGELNILSLNLIENLQRKEVSLTEQSRIFDKLNKEGLSDDEISSVLSIPKARVLMIKRALRVPDEFKDKIVLNLENRNKKNRKYIPATTAVRLNDLIRYNNLKKYEKDIFEMAREDGFSSSKALVFGKLLREGYSYHDAKKKIRDCVIFRPTLIIAKSQMDHLKKNKIRPEDYISDICYGKTKDRLKKV